jgi:hypothetical protein
MSNLVRVDGEPTLKQQATVQKATRPALGGWA